MKQKNLLFAVIILLSLSFMSITSAIAEDTFTIEKIRYKLDSGEIQTIDIDDVELTFYEDGSAHQPELLYTFPETLDGTITEMDLYLSGSAGDFWFCTYTSGGQINNQYFSGDGTPGTTSGITATNSTDKIYIGFYGTDADEPPQIVTPGTE